LIKQFVAIETASIEHPKSKIMVWKLWIFWWPTSCYGNATVSESHNAVFQENVSWTQPRQDH